jgi:hypothetical protein
MSIPLIQIKTNRFKKFSPNIFQISKKKFDIATQLNYYSDFLITWERRVKGKDERIKAKGQRLKGKKIPLRLSFNQMAVIFIHEQ